MRETVFLVALAMFGTTLVLVARAIAAAIGGRKAQSELGQIREQLAQHEAALDDAQATLDQQSTQLGELQERLDFTERLLAQSRDRPGLGPGEPQS
ncbi:MAG TPA: hypothetical protein VGP61_06895 [Gemmatimonadales bacterium]|nr:hypothetical protein [Gemmatimonadales bacterium]